MDRLLKYFTPKNYLLDLTIDRKTETITGLVKVTGAPHSHKIKFHAVGLAVHGVKFYPMEYSSAETTELAYRQSAGCLTITLPEELSLESELTIAIEWTTSLNHDMQSCYLSTYEYRGQTEYIAATQFESHYARECFPCIDEPAAKATFELIITVPDFVDGDIVLANTPLLGPVDSDKHQFHFQPSPRMSTYLLAWVIGKFHQVETTNKNGVKVTSYCALNQSPSSLTFANDTAARALEYYDEKFGQNYPLPKLDQVALPDFEAGAMENWGLVTYRESMMLADTTATLDTKQSIAITVTHELSHQWFGDLVTMEWWDDLWLNESFASIMEYYCTDALYPEFHAWQDFFTGDAVAALRRDALAGVQAVKQPVHNPAEIATLFDGAIVYAKGARLILMLIRLMGKDKFDQGIKDYFEKFQYQNTVGDDLWQSLQPYADFNVRDFMHVWISQPGFPAVKSGEQHRFLLDGSTDNSQWPLPEIFDDMSGHYLLDLTSDEFDQKLSQFTDLSLEQKLRLLIDRLLLAKTPAVSSDSLLNLLEKFAHEDSAAVWSILSHLINDLKLFCPPETAAYQNYQKYLMRIFGKRITELDLGEGLNADATRVRDHLLGIAIYSEDSALISKLARFYQDNLAAINPELRPFVFLAYLQQDEAKAFPELSAQYRSATDPEIRADLLQAVSSHSKQKEHQKALIDLLEQPEIIRPQDHLYLFIYLLRNSYTRSAALDWLITHWHYVEQLTGEKSIEDYPRYAAALLRTPAEAKKFYQFFDPLMENPILSRTLEIAHTEIAARLELIELDGSAVAAKLRQLIG